MPVADPSALRVAGPTVALRYATTADAPALLELAADKDVTRFFSWGPYRRLAEPEGYIASLAGKRNRGELLDFVVVDGDDRPVGVTGLSELARRDRRATVGTWFGRRWWGSGIDVVVYGMLAADAAEAGLDELEVRVVGRLPSAFTLV